MQLEQCSNCEFHFHPDFELYPSGDGRQLCMECLFGESMRKKPLEKLVTGQQLEQGYEELVDGIRFHREYRLISQHAKGIFVVEEPYGSHRDKGAS